MIFAALVAKTPAGRVGSAGSGHNDAQMTARQAASGRRAHHIWRVEMCPWRIDFSRLAWAEMRLMGRSTSMRRFGYFWVICFLSSPSPRPHPEWPAA